MGGIMWVWWSCGLLKIFKELDTIVMQQSNLILIVAFSAVDAHMWAGVQRLEKHRYRYLTTVEMLQGLRDCRVVFLPMAQHRSNYSQLRFTIEQAVLTHSFTMEEVTYGNKSAT